MPRFFNTAAVGSTRRAETLGYRVPRAARHDGEAAAFLDGVTLHLVDAGDGPVGAMDFRIHVDDRDVLDAFGAGVERLSEMAWGTPVGQCDRNFGVSTTGTP